MKITAEDYKYIAGDKFSNGYKMCFENNTACSRIDMICESARGSFCLHIGCCDHIPLIKDKVKNNIWLQKRLETVCEKVVGIDINKEAVDYVRSQGYSDCVYTADILNGELQSKVPLQMIDVVVLGEILEHVDNPVSFLEHVRKEIIAYKKQYDKVNLKGSSENIRMGGGAIRMLITVPNALNFECRYSRKPHEIINSDHRYWFTPYTICKVMYKAGIKPVEVKFADNASFYGRFTSRIYRMAQILIGERSKKMLKYKSYCGETLIAIGEVIINNDNEE